MRQQASIYNDMFVKKRKSLSQKKKTTTTTKLPDKKIIKMKKYSVYIYIIIVDV